MRFVNCYFFIIFNFDLFGDLVFKLGEKLLELIVLMLKEVFEKEKENVIEIML